MKTRPILIAATGIIVLVGIVLFVRSKASLKADNAGVTHFLNDFNRRIRMGDDDAVLACFDTSCNKKTVSDLLNILTRKINTPFEINLDTSKYTIKSINNDSSVVSINVTFNKNGPSPKRTFFTFKLRPFGVNSYEIYKMNVERFSHDYEAYSDSAFHAHRSDKVVFSLLTLAAFKTAESLKTRYDSVVWFAHLNGKTFFYVANGKWKSDKYLYRYEEAVVEPCKMGLVNPQLKEIIPLQYDLIHSINATFKGMVEVEKNNKRGFYNLNGKLLVPVRYDQIFPIDDASNLAVLRSGNDYFYLKNDTTISAKVDLKISAFFPKIRNIAGTADLYQSALALVTEYNSKYIHAAIYIPPSYLVDLGMIRAAGDFKNPLRQGDYEEVSEDYNVTFTGNNDKRDSWFDAAFYSIRSYFLGGRSGLYYGKDVVIVDKKRDQLFSHSIRTDYASQWGGGELLKGRCNINGVKAINDSLFEVKLGSTFYFELYDSTKSVTGGPKYHYLAIRNNKLTELEDERLFGFTKYIKMDDSYLMPCYNMLLGKAWDMDKKKPVIADHVTAEMLLYMKNEIYADYAYHFNDKRWQAIFKWLPQYTDPKTEKPISHANVDDRLTEIDKYNINWINQKLEVMKTGPNSLAQEGNRLKND